MIEDTAAYPVKLLDVAFPKLTREFRVQVVRAVLWYRGEQDRAGVGDAGARPAGPVAR